MKVPEKISFWPFWPFFGQKYIACGDKLVFSGVFAIWPKSVLRNFLIFGRKLGLPNATEVKFSDFGRKIPFCPFWPFYVKNGHFWPKINILANFSKLGLRIFLVLHI